MSECDLDYHLQDWLISESIANAIEDATNRFSYPSRHLSCSKSVCHVWPELYVDPPFFIYEHTYSLTQRLEMRDLYCENYMQSLARETAKIRQVCESFQKVRAELKYKFTIENVLEDLLFNQEQELIPLISKFCINTR